MNRLTLSCLLAAALPALALGGCGDAGRSSGALAKAGSGVLLGDEDGDYKDVPRGGYYDADDSAIRDYGHAAGASDTRALTALLRRYYAAAAADDGRAACALTYSLLVETLPEEYGQPPGPRYLSGAATCPAVLAIVFKRFHAKLVMPFEVESVRVSGERAEVLIGSRTLQAGMVTARREGRAWKIDGLLATPLP
ncbi:MAG TPA: hypothetical protein VIJ50_07955 [Solirubrobacteraceae bacterium]